MKARKKTGTIDVQQFHAGTVQAWPPHVRWQQEETRTAVWNEPQQTWVGVNDGDYIRLDQPTDVYPIAATYFAANYEWVSDEAAVR